MSQPTAAATGPTVPLPPGGPAVRWWVFVAPLLAVLVVAAGVAVLVVSGGSRDASDAHAMGVAAPLELASVSDDIATVATSSPTTRIGFARPRSLHDKGAVGRWEHPG